MIRSYRKPWRALILCLLLCLVICFCGCSGSGAGSAQQKEPYVHVDGPTAAEMIETGEYLLVDVRTEIPFNMGHIPGAINLPYDTVSADPDEPVELLPDKSQPLIIYCEYGGSSKEVAEKLAAKGYTDITEFDGLLVWEGELETS